MYLAKFITWNIVRYHVRVESNIFDKNGNMEIDKLITVEFEGPDYKNMHNFSCLKHSGKTPSVNKLLKRIETAGAPEFCV